MKTIDRREFTGAALAALAGAMLPSRSLAESGPAALPTVRWGKHSITRVLVGHNPIKGTSHFTPELSREMKEYFAGQPQPRCRSAPAVRAIGDQRLPDGKRSVRRNPACFLRRGREGAVDRHVLFQAGRGVRRSLPGSSRWSRGRSGRSISAVRPTPSSDRASSTALDTLKMLRDAGLMVGLCSHNHEVIDYAENKGWDVDFYQCCFYRVSSSLKPKPAAARATAQRTGRDLRGGGASGDGQGHPPGLEALHRVQGARGQPPLRLARGHRRRRCASPSRRSSQQTSSSWECGRSTRTRWRRTWPGAEDFAWDRLRRAASGSTKRFRS